MDHRGGLCLDFNFGVWQKNLWLYAGLFKPGDFGRVTLVSGSLDSVPIPAPLRK